jgi:uncharacterized protein
MEISFILGYIAAVIIGISLGLIGSGGSILTVPILVYLFHIEPVLATAYSLLIVGLTSFFGAFNNFRKNQISLPTALIFGVPAIASVFITRKYIIPALPNYFFQLGEVMITKGIALLIIFAVLMIISSYSMIRDKQSELEKETKKVKLNIPIVLTEGLIVGFVTGLVGAGGGFLIIPALVLFSGLSMKKAVGTSLLIISAKSLIGFTGDMMNFKMDWFFLMMLSLLSTSGIFIGGWIGNYISGDKLKPSFGWFILVMGVYIIVKELWM